MPTFGTLKTTVSRKLLDPNNTAVSASDVGTAVNDSINYWKFRRYWFNESSATATMTSQVSDITSLLPSDFLVELPENGFTIPFDNITYELDKVSPQEFDRESITNGYGLPYIYTWRAGVYSVYWVPQQAYSLNIYYLKDYVPLVNASDTNDFTTYADQLITYETLGRLMGEDRQDLEMNNTYSAKADREYRSLTQRAFKQTGSGSLAVETIL